MKRAFNDIENAPVSVSPQLGKDFVFFTYALHH